MNLGFFLRNNLNFMPYGIGKIISFLPYSFRPGISKSYRDSQKELLVFNTLEKKKKEEYLFFKIKKITIYAYQNIAFYKDYYNSLNFNPMMQLNSFNDIKRIPIIKKELLLKYNISDRSVNFTKAVQVNTGGSSGKTLSFFTPSEKMGIEWAHLHYIWKKQMKFKVPELKLMLVGRNDVRNYVDYDFVRNSLRLDIYSDYNTISKVLLGKYKKVQIKFLHGYPSAIYELALYCKTNEQLKERLKRDLKGIILNSEFPYDYLRITIEEVFGVKTNAFYGHSEGCIIAYEIDKNKYKPLHTYGYVETDETEGESSLIGTNYYNFQSPMIRYDTEDIAFNCEYRDSLLSSFSIKEGRSGEYILDKKNKKIPLTGLIFGRHHKLFDYCVSIQASQSEIGQVEILYVINQDINLSKDFNPMNSFDSSKVDIEFTFREIPEPVKSISGKFKLLI
ncbi:hypothetical protein [Flavobacterium sp. KMS]|uniref:hypothetical protein n=1 Tax=unclassified Flavobacterium TaxID=196869 RepID=UPI00058069AC|nr:hypothetical protein [Flavobacterium sp. KMS]KIA96295.1 hypothetical protein OA93_16790 [Flavobacterium sp. KMS]